MTNKIEVIPTGAALGADVMGVDVHKGVDDAVFDQILEAWRDHLVLRFRNQDLDEESLTAFSARFGELDPAPTRPANVPHHPSRPEINVLSNIVVDGKPIVNRRKRLRDVPVTTALSDTLSKDLKRRGFRFVGSTICYSYMQAVGLVNDHLVDCFRYPELS